MPSGHKMTNKDFLEKINLKKYTPLESFSKVREPILIRFNECGHEYKVQPQSILYHNSTCKICSSEKKTKRLLNNNENLKQEAYKSFLNKVNPEFTIIGNYVNNKTQIIIRHNCGYEFKCTPLSFDNNCPLCNPNGNGRFLSYSTTEYKEKINKKFNNQFLLLSEYKNNLSEITIKNNKCGHEYTVIPKYFVKNGSVCPICSQSSGEILIENYLLNNNIAYKKHVRLSECVNKKPLEIDFIVEANNTKMFIEYDGEFHYQEIYGKDRLLQQKENDSIKDEYAHNNNIRMIRIPYWEKENIESILNNLLKEVI